MLGKQVSRLRLPKHAYRENTFNNIETLDSLNRKDRWLKDKLIYFTKNRSADKIMFPSPSSPSHQRMQLSVKDSGTTNPRFPRAVV